MPRLPLALCALSLFGCNHGAAPGTAGPETDALPVADAAVDAAPDQGPEPDAAPSPEPAPFAVSIRESAVNDPARDREIGLMVYAPQGHPGPTPVVLISHGGQGSARGQRTLAHLGTTYAGHGWLAIHLGHRPSADALAHRHDRPADVSHALDRLEAGQIPLPPQFAGSPDLDRVAHVGHSWGAYTAHAVAGATFEHGRTHDPRIDAIVPISPQGAGGFGAFIDPDTGDTSWSTLELPVLTLIGAAEMDGPPGQFRAEGWRLQPFTAYPATHDRVALVLADQTHAQMGNDGSPAVLTFIAEQSLRFLDHYVAGRPGAPCALGDDPAVSVERHRKGPPDGALAGCTD